MDTYEEKYKEALERAKENYSTCYAPALLEKIFPELKESEDEKIIETIKHCLRYCNGGQEYTLYNDGYDKCIAWLEKQVPIDEEKVLIGARKGVALSIMNYLDNNTVGMCLSNMECEDLEDAVVNSKWDKVYTYMKKKLEKQGEPANKVEPKFHEGEWVVNNEDNSVGQIKNIIYDESGYGYDHTNGWFHSVFEKDYHLWTIKDAKDGDVLIENGCPFIFKCTKPSHIKTKIKNPLAVLGYCGIDGAGFVNSTKTRGWGDTANCRYYPATKEQRDKLMKAMADAGYYFDFDKKELKKIEQKPADETSIAIKNEEAYRIGFADGEAYANEQKPIEWSEEDEIIREVCSNLVKMYYGGCFSKAVKNRYLDWLNSLKDRVQPLMNGKVVKHFPKDVI